MRFRNTQLIVVAALTVALFLTSDAASYITGRTHLIDGGMLRQSEGL